MKRGCVPLSKFDDLVSGLESKEELILGALADAGTRLDSLEGESEAASARASRAEDRLSRAELRAEEAEEAARRYNLVVEGLRPRRRLERPTHLDKLVKEEETFSK